MPQPSPQPVITLVTQDKKRFLDLLLLADESEDAVDNYLERGDMFVMAINQLPVAVCVVTNNGDGVFEVQNLAVSANQQRRGHGTRLLAYVRERYRGCGTKLLVGTGDTVKTVAFYQAAGFTFDHRVPRGIANAYNHPVIEDGVVLIDKVYFSQDL